MMTPHSRKPFVLLILDGWGERADPHHNPILSTPTPTWDTLRATYPHGLIEASGLAVGLPAGQMGNSEVGHLHIGAGRKVPQDLTRIERAIQSGEFQQLVPLLASFAQLNATKRRLHILGLLSPGGVHSHESHLFALMQCAKIHQIPTYLHAFLDGRDTPPQSAYASLAAAEQQFAQMNGQIASIVGRYYAMDRDQRWDRVQKAYQLLATGSAPFAASTATEALQLAYARGETDEFVQPTAIHAKDQAPIHIESGDMVIFMNFRADRARQITHAFLDMHFDHFERPHHPTGLHWMTLTEYEANLPVTVLFPPVSLTHTLGQQIADLGLKQLRLAETEKYAHVTYFLNGGREIPFPGEERILIPSPRIATYDLQPEMSAESVTDTLVKAILEQRYDLIVCNYANPDMVGHAGVETASCAAVQVIDACLKRIWDALQQVHGEMLITADHGNIECAYDEIHHQPHTAHTTEAVPVVYIGRTARCTAQATVNALDDIAPTVLYLMGLPIPSEMTGKPLFHVL